MYVTLLARTPTAKRGAAYKPQLSSIVFPPHLHQPLRGDSAARGGIVKR